MSLKIVHRVRPNSLTSLFTFFFCLLLSTTVLHELNAEPAAQAQSGSRAPSNDMFSSAAVLGFPAEVTVNDIELATVENGEPLHGCRRIVLGTGSYSVWYRFTLIQPGKVTLSTVHKDTKLDPEDDSIISIYRGASLLTLEEVACNDDSGSSLYSVVDAYLEPGSYFAKVSYWPNTPSPPMEATSVLKVNASFIANAFTLTPSLTPTLTVTVPTATATLDPSVPTVTPSVTIAPPTSTPTATTVGASENLIQNGDFEFDLDGDKVPDGWEGAELQKDKRACNTSKKIIAHHGMCAFQFKNKAGESSKLMQVIPVDSLTKGETLTFSGAFEVTQPVGKTIVLKVIYAEPDAGLKHKGKDKLKIRLDAITYGYSRLSQSFTLLGTPTKMTIKLAHSQQDTRLMIDDLSLKRQKP